MWRTLPVLGLAGLAFIGGILSAIYQTPPYRMVRDAWIASAALLEQRSILTDPWPRHLWYPAPPDELTPTSVAAVPEHQGYTLFTCSSDCSARLIDAMGNEVHRWQASFRDVWPDARHVESWLPDKFVYMRRAEALPGGDLLTLYESPVNSPPGCGLAKLDRNSRVLWTFDANAHHDFCLDEQGAIYVLTNRLRRLGDADSQLTETTTVPVVFEDRVTILTPAGEIIKHISVLDALLASPFFYGTMTHIDHRGDITHNNTVNRIGQTFAAQHEGVEPGDLMLCLRNLNLVVALNPDSEQIVWASTGAWNHPHDPDPLENGNLLIFDNIVAFGTETGSRVVEYDPRRQRIVWSYEGQPQRRLRSEIRACQQALPDGRVLITESERGRILEVDRDGRVTWQYTVPDRGGEHGELVPIVCGARRYAAEEVPFAASENYEREAAVAQQPDMERLADDQPPPKLTVRTGANSL